MTPEEFIPQGALPPELRPTDFQFGANTTIANEIVFPDGCLSFAPVLEIQVGVYFDTYGCVSYSFNNGAEIWFNKRIGDGKFSKWHIDWLKDNGYMIDGKVRFSNRWLVVRSGTVPNLGNSGGRVADYARNHGLAPLTLCDWDLSNRDYGVNNPTAYYDASTINPKADEVAKKFQELFDIRYEWVWRTDLDQASKEGAIQVYVNAWYQNNGVYYNPVPGKSNHAIDLGRFSDLTLIDQYNPQFKKTSKLEDLYPSALKINIYEKNMSKPIVANNTLIQLVTAPGGFGLYLDGKIIVDETDKILASFMVRTNGDTKGKVKPMVLADWNLFPHVNLKGEPVK